MKRSPLIIANTVTLPQNPGKPEDPVLLKCNLPQAPGEKGAVGLCTKSTAGTRAMYSTGRRVCQNGHLRGLQGPVGMYQGESILQDSVE